MFRRIAHNESVLQGIFKRRIQRNTESGSVSVEFALILVPFLLLIFGLIQYGLYFYGAQSGSHVADRTVRQLSVGNCQTQATLENFILDELGGATTANSASDPDFNVRVTDDADANMLPFQSSDVGETVILKIKFPTLNMHFPFLPFLDDSSIVREVEARVEDTTDGGCPS